MLSGKSLSYPIIAIFIAIAVSSMLITYSMDLGLLREVCDDLDAEEVRHLSQLAGNTIEEEFNHLNRILFFIKTRQALVQEAQKASLTPGNREGLLETADEIYRHLEIGSILIVDNRGRVLYRSEAPDRWGDIPDIWGLDEALWGQDIILASHGDNSWKIRAASPLITQGRQVGAILIDVPVNRILIRSLIRFSEGRQFFFGGVDGEITFHKGNDVHLIDKEPIIRSFIEKRAILRQVRGKRDYTILYTPLTLVDETMCLIVLAYNEKSQAILADQRRKLTQNILLTLVCCIFIGFGFIIWLLKPLKILEKEAWEVVKEITGREAPQIPGNEVSSVVESIHIMTETLRKHIEQLSEAKDELARYSEIQQVLLREVNHRVKNNLAVIISMLNMEITRTDNNVISVSLKDLIRRIEALAALHSLLSARNWRPLPIGELCRQVILTAIYSYPESEKINLNVTRSSIEISSNQSHHLTMVINELAINSLKYAVAGKDNIKIDVTIEERGKNAVLTYRDNGPGYPARVIQGDNAATGLGFDIMRGIMSHSMNGGIRFKNDRGAIAVLEFENDIAVDGKWND